MNFYIKIIYAALMMVVLSFGLYTISNYSLCEWDESRNGVNAFEMLQNKHYFGLYYDGVIDSWNSKPPLMIWLISLSYKIFGVSVLALRIASYLAFIATLFVLYKIITQFETKTFAFYCIGILVTCKAFMGYHMGLNGDFDMLLTFFLTCSLYYFLKFHINQNFYAIIYAAFFISCAFLTKGPPAFIYLPGFLIYLIIRKDLSKTLKSVQFWIGILVITSFIAIWYLNSKSYTYVDKSHYGSKNPIETLFMHDTFNRLFSSSFKSDASQDYGFVLSVMESRFGIWFYAATASALILLILKRNVLKLKLPEIIKKPLVVLSFCISLPIITLLTFSSNQNSWYLSPIFFFQYFWHI